jgi:purine-binding chemotaxis protein CheW
MAEKTVVAEKQLVVFEIGNESYAVDINTVREIIQLQPITRVPGTPLSVEGVINLRGSVIPIMDLRKRFQLNNIERTKDTRIVVVNSKGSEMGIIVDSVAQVLRIPVDSIDNASSVFNEKHLEYLLGIVKLPNRLVILLDMDRVLSKEEDIVLETRESKKKDNTEKATVT